MQQGDFSELQYIVIQEMQTCITMSNYLDQLDITAKVLNYKYWMRNVLNKSAFSSINVSNVSYAPVHVPIYRNEVGLFWMYVCILI